LITKGKDDPISNQDRRGSSNEGTKNILSLIRRDDIVAPTSNSHSSDHHVLNNCLNGGSLEENCKAIFCPACWSIDKKNAFIARHSWWHVLHKCLNGGSLEKNCKAPSCRVCCIDSKNDFIATNILRGGNDWTSLPPLLEDDDDDDDDDDDADVNEDVNEVVLSNKLAELEVHYGIDFISA
jgi:hypothetical protein